MTCHGYLRASTNLQDINHGKAEIECFAVKHNLGPVIFFEDAGVSSNADWRQRKIYDIIQLVRRGDWDVVQEQSRLSRKPLDILSIQELLHKKGVALHSVKEAIT